MLRWPLTVDQTIALTIGLPGTLAATVAAVWTVKTYRFVRAASTRDAALRDIDVQPRLVENWFNVHNYVGPFLVSNTGESAPDFFWVGQQNRWVGMCRGPVPADSSNLAFDPIQLGEAQHNVSRRTVLLVAQDIHGRWWDCQTRKLLEATVRQYLIGRMTEAGLGNLVENLLVHLG